MRYPLVDCLDRGLVALALTVPLPATFTEVPDTADPGILHETEVLVPGAGAPGGRFGRAVARSGDRVAVGEPGGAGHAGAVYVYLDDPVEGWVLEAKLTDGLDARPGEGFGAALDLEGSALVVGVPQDEDASGATGKAVVYELGASGWELTRTLRPADLEAGDRYGASVSVVRRSFDDQLRVAVGAPEGGASDLGAVYLHQSNPGGDWFQVDVLEPAGGLAGPGVFGRSVDQTEWRVAVGGLGKAFVFAWNFAGSWVLEDDLSLASSTAYFGGRVCMPDSGRLFVGDVFAENTNAVPCGAIYTFQRSGSDWTVSIRISPLDGLAGDAFGRAFAVHGDRLVASSDDLSAPDAGMLQVWEYQGATWYEVDRFATDELASSLDVASAAIAVGYAGADGSVGGEGQALLYADSGGAWSLLASLEGTNLDPDEGYGRTVAQEGDRLVVAAPRDGDAGYEAGAVFVFRAGAGGWELVQKLTPGAQARPGAQFGRALDLGPDRLVVGAPGSEDGGAVHVFEWTGATFVEQERLQVSTQDDAFGRSVALDGDRLLASARDYVPVAGPPGGAFLFEWDGQDWVLVERLTAGPGAIGSAVALDDELAVVTDVEFDGAFDFQGVAYLFDRTAGAWSLLARVDAPEPAAYGLFGFEVQLGAGRLVVSSPNHGPGRLSVFALQSGAWVHQAELAAPVSSGSAGLGYRTAMEGERVLAGAALGNGAYGRGTVYVFRESGSGWSEEARLVSTRSVQGDGLGAGLAISGGTVVAGAPGTDEARGSAHLFELGAPTPFVSYCFGDGSAAHPCPCGNAGAPGEGCANSSGTGARLVASGSASLAAEDLVVTFQSDLPGKPALLFSGVNALGGTPFGDGLRCAGGATRRLGLRTTDGAGLASWGPGISSAFGIAPGQSAYLQVWHRDPQGPCGSGFGLSAALEVVLGR